MKRSLFILAFLCLNADVEGWPAGLDEQDGPTSLALKPSALVSSRGIYLQDVLAESVPAITNAILAPAPAPGQVLVLTRRQVCEALAKQLPPPALSRWIGPAQVRVARAARKFEEPELRLLLTEALQRGHIRESGDLELRFARPWSPVSVPDEALSLKVLELPNAGITASFIVRFELATARETVGAWQVPVQARIWREVVVARTTLPRGRLLTEADLGLERRDTLALRDLLAPEDCKQPGWELAENVMAGTPLTHRSLKLRPVVRRGKLVDAIVEEGPLSISARVEALEDGAPGQIIRLRNTKSRKEIYGKVQNEQTVLVSM
jgi:flagella basal body P-ring formation protein FlgA